MATPLRPPPGSNEKTSEYRHWTLEELWRFRDEVVEYANHEIIAADTLEYGGHPVTATQIRDRLQPLLELIGKYQEKAKLT